MGPFREERRDVQSTDRGKEDVGGTRGPVRTLTRNCSEPAALRREHVESNHREERATGKESEVDYRRHKHNPRKRRNFGMHVGHSGQIVLRRDKCEM
jgi:hypothetical protein